MGKLHKYWLILMFCSFIMTSCLGNQHYRIDDTTGFLFADQPKTRPYNPSHWHYNHWEVQSFTFISFLSVFEGLNSSDTQNVSFTLLWNTTWLSYTNVFIMCQLLFRFKHLWFRLMLILVLDHLHLLRVSSW